MAPKSVLFVCMGNICRSPAAEGVFRKHVEDRGLSGEVRIDSAGTIGYHTGEPADRRMRKAAARRGYTLDSTSRQFKPSDFTRFDLIVAMDRENRRDILSLDPEGRYSRKVRLLCDFIDDIITRDVPDPYYGGDKGFEEVLDLIEKASEPILDALLNGRKEPS